MPSLSQSQFSEQMVAQLRLLKPSISAEVGTPERLIIDTVAGALAESSIDIVALQEALNVNTKYGTNLTNFLSIFGFARQEATTATGFVIFSRNSPANVPILIPAGTIVKSTSVASSEGLAAEFYTTASVTLPEGKTEAPLCPVKATVTGSAGNVGANTITVMSLAPVLGITAVTNPTATTGGQDQESDNELKVRFKNTVFRNLAGTEDSYLALAISTAFSTKANVLGPVSKYKEYFQVPGVAGSVSGDDTTAYAYGGGGSTAISGEPTPTLVRGSVGNGSNVATIPSTLRINTGESITIWEGVKNPKKAFVGTIKTILSATTIELSGSASAMVTNGWFQIGTPVGSFANKWTAALSINPYIKNIWSSLQVFVSTYQSGLAKFFFREGVDFEFNSTPKLQGDTLRALIDGTGQDPRNNTIGPQPNITFTNVYLGSEEPNTALAPGQVVLVEYAYTSTASRNSLEHNVTNAIDVYVNGTNEQPTSTNFTAPLAHTQEFVDEPLNMFYLENYRRDGEPTKRPIENNILTPLYQQPVIAIPNQILIGTNLFYKGVHFWLTHDVSNYSGTIRARDGIEWSSTIPADLSTKPLGRPGTKTAVEEEPEYKGLLFNEINAPTLIEVPNYTYDANIADLQAAFEKARQITTDTLGHKSKVRYFKYDVTVVYSPQATPSSVNEQIRASIETFFEGQWFGSVIRLSDILQVIHGVTGVENVRWSNDVPNTHYLTRAYETDVSGKPLQGWFFDRTRWGKTGQKEIQTMYLVGNPTEGAFQFRNAGTSSAKTTIQTFTNSILETMLIEAFSSKVGAGLLSEDKRSSAGVTQPIRSWKVTLEEKPNTLIEAPQNFPEEPITGGEYSYNSDYFLRDNELPKLPTGTVSGDTIAGLIIRPRAENVWQKG